MYLDFDFHSPSRRIALARTVDAAQEILLFDVESGDSLGRIGPELFPSEPRFSPDGSRLAFFGDGRIYVHSLESGTSDAVVDLADGYAGLASWSPDGRSLTFSALDSPADLREWAKIFRLDLADGRMVQLTEGPGLDRYADWSADGARLAFRRTLVDFPIYYHAMMVTDRDGAATTRVPLPDGMSQLTSRHCWSPDGAFLVLWEGDNWKEGRGALSRRLRAFRVDDMSVAWTLEGETLLGGCFDPRGGRVLAAAEDRLTLYAFPSGNRLDELSLEGLAPLRHISTRVAVCFDSEEDTVYFLGRDGKLYRWQVGGSCDVAHEDRPEELTIQLRSEEYSFTSRNGREVPVRRYLPRAPNGHAVMIEAGPWSGHDPHPAVLLRMLEEGYEVVRPTYRATGPTPGQGWPLEPGVFGRDDVHDLVDCAVDWKRRFGADLGSLALVGVGFPGGYLAFLALTYPEAPWSCAVAVSARTVIGQHMETLAMPPDPSGHEEEMRRRSPVARADEIRFPLLMLHAGRDPSAPLADTEAIQAGVRRSGFRCDLVVFENDQYGLPLGRPRMFDAMLGFLRDHWTAPPGARGQVVRGKDG